MSPLATTATIDAPPSLGYGVAFDGQLFRLAVGPGRELSVQTAPLQAERIRTSDSPEEFLAEFGDVFAQSEWAGGEGLFRAHTEGAAKDRYWDSKNIDVALGEPGTLPAIRLLHAATNLRASANTNQRLATDGISIWKVDGTTIVRTDDPSATTPTWVSDDPHAGEAAVTVNGVVLLGSEVYAALGANGIHQKTGGAWAHWNNVAATRIWAVKGRIVASDGRNLYEVTAAGVAPAALKTLAPGVTWTDVTDVGAAIAASATDGYVYCFTDNAGTLTLAGQSYFEGEEPYAVGSGGDYVFVGTRQPVAGGAIGRLWRCELDSNYVLAERQTLRQWGTSSATVDHTPRRIVATRDNVYTAVTEDATETHLWRYDLTTGGLARHLTLTASGLTLGIVSVAGRLFASVAASGLWRETTTYATNGYLIGPLGDFYSASDKSWSAARIDTGSIPAGASVALYYTTDPEALSDPNSTAWVRIRSLTGGSGTVDQTLSAVTSRSLAGMVKLTRSTSGTETPTVRAWSFIAYPTGSEIIATIPINVSDQYERHGIARRRIPGLGRATYQALKGVEGHSTLCRIYPLDETIRGLVEEVGTPVQSITRRGAVTVYSLVKVRGRRVSVTGTADDSALGVGTLGVMTLGGTA